jgi:YihY family inner membrane protein
VDLTKILEPVLDRPRIATVRAVLDTYGAAPGGLLASGLAFTALFAAVPTTLLLLAVAGYLAADPTFQSRLVEFLAGTFPPLRDLLDGALDAVSAGSGLSSIGGLIGLVWASSQFYRALEVAFGRIFHDLPQRGVARRTAYGFLWVLFIVAVVVSVIVISSIAGLVDAVAPATLPIGRPAVEIIRSPIALGAIAVMVVAVLYRVLPAKAPSRRALGVPAIVVGITIMALTQAFAMLAPILVRTPVLGSLAAAFIALAWLSLTFQALLLGAAWVSVRARRPGG